MKYASSNLAKLGSFLRGKTYFLGLASFVTIAALLFLWAFKVRLGIIIMLAILWFGFLLVSLAVEYWRKAAFYKALLANLDRLDQAYLILETLTEPRFYDGEILYAALYKINKSMLENVTNYRMRSQEFQEYVEMWIHEVKTPLATLSLISHDPKINQQIKRLNDYVEQILYFVRAENAEQDYLIAANNLANIINEVASRNREVLLAKKIDFEVHDVGYEVYTDAKWLEFILNQIINNSIKYSSSKIRITTTITDRTITLTISDNGIGIAEKDLPRVFDKSFTGSNGRLGKQSTGMGLYIAKTLCQKLGHKIEIDSKPQQYTKVSITFAKSKYFNVIDAQTYKKVTEM